jgi:5-formyltetrahydrofolate cyclo-ligase
MLGNSGANGAINTATAQNGPMAFTAPAGAIIVDKSSRAIGPVVLMKAVHPRATMTIESPMQLQELKKSIRDQAHANRKAQDDKESLSHAICEKFMALPEFAAARSVMVYLDVRTEVRTRHDLPKLLESGKRIVIPYCVERDLELFLLESMDELSVGMYKILEPKAELRDAPGKRVDVREIDLIMVPGVAFDRRGARMGHGFGYYDKLLEHARSDTPLVALAFECQLFPEIPTQQHDVFMDKIITEQAIYPGKGR